MKHCTYCGSKIGSEHRFCGNCGFKVNNGNEETKYKVNTPPKKRLLLIIILVITFSAFVYGFKDYLFTYNGTDDTDTDEFVDEFYNEEKISSGEVTYERAENLVYNELTNPNSNLSNTNKVGFEVYSFVEKSADIYYFETDKGEFQLKVGYLDYDDPAMDLLFGKNTIEWAVYDLKTSERILSSENWNE